MIPQEGYEVQIARASSKSKRLLYNQQRFRIRSVSKGIRKCFRHTAQSYGQNLHSQFSYHQDCILFG